MNPSPFSLFIRAAPAIGVIAVFLAVACVVVGGLSAGPKPLNDRVPPNAAARQRTFTSQKRVVNRLFQLQIVRDGESRKPRFEGLHHLALFPIPSAPWAPPR